MNTPSTQVISTTPPKSLSNGRVYALGARTVAQRRGDACKLPAFHPRCPKVLFSWYGDPHICNGPLFFQKRWGGWEVRLDAAEVKSKPSEELAPDRSDHWWSQRWFTIILWGQKNIDHQHGLFELHSDMLSLLTVNNQHTLTPLWLNIKTFI